MDTTTKSVNPFFSIWTQPRATIQYIVERNYEYHVLVLTVLYGIVSALEKAVTKNLGERSDLPLIVMVCLFVGPISALISLFLGSILIRWVGSWIGGKASLAHIRAAIAWSGLPVVCTIVVFVIELILFGKELFMEEIPSISDSIPLLVTFVILSLVQVVAALWSFVLLIVTLAQVQSFTALKAFANLAIAAALVILSILIVALVIGRFLH
jgi:hypothetical protein